MVSGHISQEQSLQSLHHSLLFRLETIIPKSDLGRVMVVRGERSGELGEMLDKDKSSQKATIQLIMSEEVLVLDYDSVCEFAGSVPDYE